MSPISKESLKLLSILEKAEEIKPLTMNELNFLMYLKKPKEILTVVNSANRVKEKLKQNTASFIINRNINFTNVCENNCRFCSFSVPSTKHENAFLLNLKEVEHKIYDAVDKGCTEVCIQGGLHPDITFDYYLNLLETIRSVSREIHIHAFSPEEIRFMSRTSKESIEKVLKMLEKAGLGSMPGTAAEILVDGIRTQICPKKLNVKEWIQIVKIAHKLGIPTTATMMYGHIEGQKDIVEHLRILKEIQNETKMFTEFVPLPFIHPTTDLFLRDGSRAGATGLEDVKIHSIARLYFGDILPNIQTSWVKLGHRFAQFMLCAGVNDLGGTLFEENITKAARGKEGIEYTKAEDLAVLIRDLDLIPYQRDTLYTKFIEW